jgi:hypothetical protein
MSPSLTNFLREASEGLAQEGVDAHDGLLS